MLPMHLTFYQKEIHVQIIQQQNKGHVLVYLNYLQFKKQISKHVYNFLICVNIFFREQLSTALHILEQDSHPKSANYVSIARKWENEATLLSPN